MNILMAGDIVGSPGRKAVDKLLPVLREEEQIDFVVANAENAAGGRGVTAKIARALYETGVDAITMGDHLWDQKELMAYIAEDKRLLRPLNLSPQSPGRGWTTLPADGVLVTVVSLQGRVFMPPHADCPFRAVDDLLRGNDIKSHIIVVDMHCEATSEKIAMGRYLDGRVSAVFGTHTHVQTADDCILPGGTAYITDIGMTGPKDSVLGRQVEPVLKRFVTGMPAKFEVASGDVRLEGIIVDVDASSGRARSIRRVQRKLKDDGA